jgi:beta-N-acetylhexosaminidase
MSAHVYFPAYEEKKLPATLSRNVLTGLLRETLGFDGVIMTDSMGMKAISDHYGSVEATVMAVKAGADCILIAHGHDVQWAAIKALVEAVRSGRIPESRIDRSVERLLALRQKLGLTAESVVTSADEAYFATESFRRVGSAEHMRVAQSISEASVTLVKDESGFLPLRRDARTFVVTVRPDAVTEADERYDLPVTLGRALAAQGFDTVERVLQLVDVKRHATEVAAQAASFDQIVVGTYNASLNPDQADLVRAIRAHGKRLTVVALRNPYDLRAFPDVPAYVALYESRPLALQSAAKMLAGTIPARGRLPVTIGDRYPAGWGMTRE